MKFLKIIKPDYKTIFRRVWNWVGEKEVNHGKFSIAKV
jgi:hypothetical protein